MNILIITPNKLFVIQIINARIRTQWLKWVDKHWNWVPPPAVFGISVPAQKVAFRLIGVSLGIYSEMYRGMSLKVRNGI